MKHSTNKKSVPETIQDFPQVDNERTGKDAQSARVIPLRAPVRNAADEADDMWDNVPV